MKKIAIDKYEFLTEKVKNANIFFSTAKNNIDFNINSDIGKNNIEKLKKLMGLEDILYLSQIHSDNIYITNNSLSLYNYKGDGIITNKKNIGIGVFTADCVPVIIYDTNKEVIAAIHSGWRGTLSCIVIKAIEKMKKEFNSNPSDIVAYIGPHNMECCYEIGEDVAEKFKSCKTYKDIDIIKNNKLNLKLCISTQLKSQGVYLQNINSVDICTFCNKEYELYSYRKFGKNCGRMFSYIYMK
ncbi:conserved hypothetical protein [Clostridium sp. USBA 49]|uniref:peptidoglycan editing factor PgeF n=1 Tax=Clostridium TaxID=1485 RepID=UPI00099A0DF0|nr:MULTISPECIES: peptidoglycan editing factor PgeF [Clostridium]SKA76089.1 conserved hypothetical protein [Clostridium sp. USBA 49]